MSERRHRLHATPGLENLTNTRADVQSKLTTGLLGGSQPTTLRERLLLLGGSSTRTRSGIDLTKAAAKLGVSRRTAERWVRAEETGKGQQPSEKNLKRIERRTSAATKTGRQAIAGQLRQRLSGATTDPSMTVRGVQGPYGAAEAQYRRMRATTMRLRPDDVQAMMQAWESGGDEAMMQWAMGKYNADYLEDWGFASIDSFTIEGPQ